MKMSGKQVKIVGYGLVYGDQEKNVEVLSETKTTITVKWGNGKRKFSKVTGHIIPKQYNRWSGWKLEVTDEANT